MSFDHLKTGAVIDYPFLWPREAAAGELEGRKPRPVAVAARYKPAAGPDIVLLFPITSKPPAAGRFAVEIPEMELRRIGLSVRSWIILDEFNRDRPGASYYLEPTPPRGFFSRAFFAPILRQVAARMKSLRGVDRA